MNKKIKSILYLSMHDPFVTYNGSGSRSCAFVRYLSKRFSLDVVHFAGNGYQADPAAEILFSKQPMPVSAKHRHRIPFNRLDYFLFSHAFYAKAMKLATQKTHDIIFADYGLSPLYACLVSRRTKRPFVYSSHNIEFKCYLGRAKEDIRRTLLLPWIFFWENWGCKKSELLVAISDKDASFFSRWKDPTKILSIPQGFDDTLYHPFYRMQNNNPKVVLFVANFARADNRKAVQDIRDHIIDGVVRRHPQTVFRIVGHNPPRHIQHPCMEYTGFVDNLDHYIKDADVFISPLMQGWGMPTKIIQALACGKPIVSTPTGARTIPTTLHQLKIRMIPDFAQTICDILQQNQPVIQDDFETIKKCIAGNTT